MTERPLLTRREHVAQSPEESDPDRTIVTRDHAVIRSWAERFKGEPATGEASPSGPATVTVTDGGAGIRFNFPGVSPYRTIPWDEWFAHFDAHELTFVYEQPSQRAPTPRYRIVKTAEWKEEMS